MRKRGRIFGKGAAIIAVGVAAISVTQPAAAALVTWTFKGKINQVNNVLDPFGVPDVLGPLATPLDFTYAVTFDTAIGQLVTIPGNQVLYGALATPSVRKTSLTINGVTDTVEARPNELYYADIGRFGGPSSGGLSILHYGGLNNVRYWTTTIGITSYAGNSPLLGDPFVSQAGIGAARLTHFEAVNGVFSHLYELQGIVTSASVGVPEPQTWALMIVGFGLAGAALRRRPSPLAA